MKRIASIDLLRGLVIALMALDHTRELLHLTSITQSPTDLATTTPPLYFTRWVTHLCAPVFVFLAGTSAYLSQHREAAGGRSSNHLLYRGGMLVVLEFTLITFGIWFDLQFRTFMFQVIAAIGGSLVVLHFLRKRLSPRTIGWTGVTLIVMHQALSLLAPLHPVAQKVLTPLVLPGAFPLGGDTVFIMSYPLVPWMGILLAGYGCGPLFLQENATRKRLFWRLAVLCLSAFLLLRLLNGYGDTQPWTAQTSGLYTLLSFLNVSKYPPSLVFTALMLGLMFLLLALLPERPRSLHHPLLVYGRTSLFFYLVHWYLLHAAALLVLSLQGYALSELDFSALKLGRPREGVSGLPLWSVYAVWLGALLVLYPLCRWYGAYKQAHPHRQWLRFL